LHEDWKLLTEQQRERELDLKKKEQELVLQRQELEQERLKVLDEVSVIYAIHCSVAADRGGTRTCFL